VPQLPISSPLLLPVALGCWGSSSTCAGGSPASHSW
jgi:hypothetical protein